VNVTVENLAPCKKLVKVEIESTEVDAAFESFIREYQRQASLPGFRPGKAPKGMIAKRFEKDIHDEVKKKLIPDAYRKAIDEQKLDVVGYPDIEEIQFGKGQALQFAATVETAPEFQLPEYKGLPAKRDTTTVTEEDVQRAVDLLRERKQEFRDVNRPAAAGDVVVIHFKGTVSGQPILELAPASQGLYEQKDFWLKIEPGAFIPGFAEQLTGAAAGEKRTLNIEFPADFSTPELAGKQAVYEVNVAEVKEKVLPPLDQALADAYGAENVEKLLEGVRKDLENELKYKKDRSVRNQLMQQLMQHVSFELPESAVSNETRNVVYDIVMEHQKRGYTKADIEQQREQIYNTASDSAKLRVKSNFLLRKIAEKEDIKVSQEEVGRRVQTLAAMYNIPMDQFIKRIQERNGIVEVYDQVSAEKTLDFLQENARIEDVAPSAPPA